LSEIGSIVRKAQFVEILSSTEVLVPFQLVRPGLDDALAFHGQTICKGLIGIKIGTALGCGGPRKSGLVDQAMMDGVQREFQAVGYSQFVEDIV
jgi:hypothetical protein